jgi:hypothetical protein
MDTETLSLAEIRARIVEIECELFAHSALSNITSPNSAELNRAHAIRFEALGRERSDLMGRLPLTGMASGERIVIAKVLGDICNWPQPEPEPDDYDRSDPYERYEREVGINRDD